jgi:pilus assembly protein CpaE
MNRTSCLIVETDQEAIRQIDILCRRIGSIEVRWKTHSVPTGVDIVRKHLPEVAIVGLGPAPDGAIEAISRMAREFPFLYLVALSERTDSELILRTIRAGAHDFLCKPVKEIDLRAAAEKAANLKATRKEAAARSGKILSVFSSKGGNGTTTIAVNLADSLARLTGKKVAVVDLVLSHGDVAMFFNVNPSYSILDLARNAEKADYDFLHSLLVRHQSGVYILADPPMIEDAEQIAPQQVRDVLSALRSMFDYIVVDTPQQFDDRTLTALEMSDVLLLVSLLDLPSLKNTQRCLELFGRIGLRDERIRLVVSRLLPNNEIPFERIEGIMNTPVFCSIPNDYPTVISSINRGRLLSEIAAGKEVVKSFDRMAELLEGAQPAKPVPERKGILDAIFRKRGA